MDCIKPGVRGWHDTNSKNYLLVYVYIYIYACVLYISQVAFLQLECTCHLLFGPSNVFDVCAKTCSVRTCIKVQKADDIYISDTRVRDAKNR